MQDRINRITQIIDYLSTKISISEFVNLQRQKFPTKDL